MSDEQAAARLKTEGSRHFNPQLATKLKSEGAGGFNPLNKVTGIKRASALEQLIHTARARKTVVPPGS